MKLTQRTHPVREATYRRAFEQFTESPDFDWKERWPDGPFLALHRDNVYQIESPYDLRERAWLMLTSTDEAVYVPLSIWIAIVGDVHDGADFYARLLNRLVTPDEHKHLRLARTISQTTSRPAESFWSTLYHLDAIGLYPKAIVAAAQVSASDDIILKLERELVNNGKTFLNQVRDGVFRTLVVDGCADATDALFYVFTVDPATWEVDVLV